MVHDAIDNLKTFRYPGLTEEARNIPELRAEILKRSSIFFYKRRSPLIWVCLLGGTGTGKSTLFNALCGRSISQTGMERPKTRGPVAFVHRTVSVEKNFPLPAVQIDRQASTSPVSTPTEGAAGHLVLIEHDQTAWCHLIVIDTPDIDSVDAANRKIAADLYLLADAVVFVTSQEKYADDVPSRLLKRLIDDNKPYFLLFNKVSSENARDDLLTILQREGLPVQTDRVWPIRYRSSPNPSDIANRSDFRTFLLHFSEELSISNREVFQDRRIHREKAAIITAVDRLLGILENDNGACRNWLNRLDSLYDKITEDLIQSETQRFTEKSHAYIRAEIRKLFTRYDVLARPRQIIREVLRIPLRVLGLNPEKQHRQALFRLKEKLDLAPVEAAVESFNRLVFEHLSPRGETSPLNRKLRQPGTVLEDNEIRDLTRQANNRLAEWLEKTFQQLAKGIPRGKRWGIYSTSILWGVLLLSLEAAIGGGFSVLDIVLDSVLAPFLTKGAVELFAFHEIRRTARELADRYRQALLAAPRCQYERYGKILNDVTVDRETFENLMRLKQTVKAD